MSELHAGQPVGLPVQHFYSSIDGLAVVLNAGVKLEIEQAYDWQKHRHKTV